MSTGKDNLLNAWRTPYGASIFQVRSPYLGTEAVTKAPEQQRLRQVRARRDTLHPGSGPVQLPDNALSLSLSLSPSVKRILIRSEL